MHYRRLRALGVGEETYSYIVVPKIVEKLPKRFYLTIIREAILNWTIKDLLVALKKELELIEEISRSIGSNLEMKKKLFYPQKATASAF